MMSCVHAPYSRVFGFLVLVFCCCVTQTLVAADAPAYASSGYSAIRRLGLDLYKALDKPKQAVINKEPIFVDTDVTPAITMVEYEGEKEPMRAVFITVGFVDLVNYVAHARAIDKLQKGYFEKYVLSLAGESGDKEIHPPANITEKKFWTEDVLNEQLSNFNQIVGVAVGTKLAHHYLGHFKKYSAQLVDKAGKDVPINNLLTEEEWAAAHRAGIINALNCGYSIQGVRAFYELIDKMPNRPAWTIHFMPANVKYAKIKKDLEKLEKDFFSGKL